jgi:hypothetical protein
VALTTTFVVAVVTIRCAILEMSDCRQDWRRFTYVSFQNFGYYTLNQIREVNGLAVSAVWLVLIVQGYWRPVPEWIDRLGRLLGVLWVISSILQFPMF